MTWCTRVARSRQKFIGSCDVDTARVFLVDGGDIAHSTRMTPDRACMGWFIRRLIVWPRTNNPAAVCVDERGAVCKASSWLQLRYNVYTCTALLSR